MDPTFLKQLEESIEQYKQYEKEVIETKQKLKEARHKRGKTIQIIEHMNQHVRTFYYAQLEKTKVIQLILDQHGIFKTGRLVCKKWNEYLLSKVRPNLIFSILFRSRFDSSNDPFPTFTSEVRNRTVFYTQEQYYANILKKNGDKRTLSIRQDALKLLEPDEKSEFDKVYHAAVAEFVQLKKHYRTTKLRSLPKFDRRNKRFYEYIIQNMMHHPIGPPLIEIYEKCFKIFDEPIGSAWHISDHVLPFIDLKVSTTFYPNLPKYLPITEIFPGYQPKLLPKSPTESDEDEDEDKAVNLAVSNTGSDEDSGSSVE